MDDATQQPTDQQVVDPTASSMNDVAGMTPPPAPVMSDTAPSMDMPASPSLGGPAAPAVDPLASMPTAPEPTSNVADASMDMPASPSLGGPAEAPVGEKAADDDYSYAEDVLNEILDSLDRIEAKLEAMEKKG